VPKDWDVVGLGIVGDEFFPILLKILEWETVLGTLEMLLHYYKNNFTRHCPNIKEAVTKFDRLEKCLMIFGGGRFHLQRRSQLIVS